MKNTNFKFVFLRNEFWYTGIQSLRFCKWPWILNWSQWISLVDIPTQSLLTIMGSIDQSSRCELDAYVIAHTKEKPCTTDTFRKPFKEMKVKRERKIRLRMSITNIHSLSPLTVGTSRLMPKRNRLKFQTLKSPYCFLFIKILQINCNPEYLGVYFLW